MIEAIQLASRGKRIFPCKPDKTPLVKWRDVATADLDIVKAWWANWPTAMIGLPCGDANNLFVIDLDTDKATGEAIGEAALVNLGYCHLLDGPRVRTPSGGLHLYFQHWRHGRNSVSQIGSGIDTRAEGGYVIAAGSQGGAGRYTGDICWDSLPKLPLGLRARSTAPTRRRAAQNASATPGEVQDLLSHVSPDCDYQTWLTVLLALHDRFNGSEEGLIIADNWSAAGTKYRTGEVAEKWRSFKGSGITFASLPALAREAGADLSAIAAKHRENA